jgi:hypothetical protein
MSKRDRQGVRTPTDIERKYSLGQIKTVRGLTAQQEVMIAQLSQSLSQYIAATNNKIGDLNALIAGLNKTIDELDEKIDSKNINDEAPTYTVATTEQELTSGEKISVAFGKIAKAVSSFISHLANKENPHNVTLSQVGGDDLVNHLDNKSNPHEVTLSQLKAFGYKRVLTSADNLNTLIEEGVYPYSTASVPQNCFYANAGVVEVIKADSDTTRIIQRVTRYGLAGASAFRTLYEGNWNAWTEYATANATIGCTDVTTKNTDLNNYTKSGMYFFTSTYTPANIPSGSNGWLLVLANSSGSMVKQLFFRAGSLTTDHQTYLRTYINGSGWSAWHTINVTA